MGGCRREGEAHQGRGPGSSGCAILKTGKEPAVDGAKRLVTDLASALEQGCPESVGDIERRIDGFQGGSGFGILEEGIAVLGGTGIAGAGSSAAAIHGVPGGKLGLVFLALDHHVGGIGLVAGPQGLLHHGHAQPRLEFSTIPVHVRLELGGLVGRHQDLTEIGPFEIRRVDSHSFMK